TLWPQPPRLPPPPPPDRDPAAGSVSAAPDPPPPSPPASTRTRDRGWKNIALRRGCQKCRRCGVWGRRRRARSWRAPSSQAVQGARAGPVALPVLEEVVEEEDEEVEEVEGDVEEVEEDEEVKEEEEEIAAAAVRLFTTLPLLLSQITAATTPPRYSTCGVATQP
ncbi:unnamed protein product, partial [Lampetra fluviatilis]